MPESERYRIRHVTEYRYQSPVNVGQQILRLKARTLPWQHCHAFALLVEPQPVSVVEEKDYFGNAMHSVSLAGPHDRLLLQADSEVSVGPRPWNIEEFVNTLAWDEVAAAVREPAVPDAVMASEFRFVSPMIPLLAEATRFARQEFHPHRPLLEAVDALNQRLYQEYDYAPGVTHIATPLLEVLANKSGVCQDFAHVLVAGLRGLGLPVRYVSGYLRTNPPEGKTRLIGADASHAWIAVWCPGWGWVEFDPTNGCLADERYIVLGWGRDFGDVSPVRGVLSGGGAHDLKVAVTVWPESEWVDQESRAEE